MKKTIQKSSRAPVWNLGLFYKSPTDPHIEKDAREIEKQIETFAKKYDTKNKTYLSTAEDLTEALTQYEEILAKGMPKPLHYFLYLRDIDGTNPIASSRIPLLAERFTKADNAIKFFEISLGSIPVQKQKLFLDSPHLKRFRIFLDRVFSDAYFSLSLPEEKIMSLKSQPAYEMWVSHNQRILNTKSIEWKGKDIPLPQALNTVQSLKTHQERKRLAQKIIEVLKIVAPFSEGELNAILTNKKINDELRGYKTPYENTVRGYRNDPQVVEQLVKTVSDNFHIAWRFHRLKARLLKQKKLDYSDRAAKIGTIKATFTFPESSKKFESVLETIGPKYRKIFQSYIKNGQIDVSPKLGKKGGAYCWGSYENPTFILLNHIDDLNSFTTLAHEMGHAFHTELSKQQGPLYHDYSTALAETASTLFESIALEAVTEKLSRKEKIILLHDKINDDISTVFRQIACFNFELDLHTSIRNEGFLDMKKIGEIHNKHMSSYLGPAFTVVADDGYAFVYWSHIRRFFYVYSYAYGMLVSKALLQRYRENPSFWKKIEEFLSAGGKDSPENILKSIGIDVSRPQFWQEGLDEISKDIDELEKLTAL